MEKSNLRRVKNILTGDYTGKTLTSLGYSKTTEKHVEGDVWEEAGKQWTIKNGIKRNVTKLDAIRKATHMPLSCPACGNVMRKQTDKRMWKLRGKCLDCIVEEDTARMKQGNFKKYEKEVIGNNLTNYVNQVKDFFEDYIDKLDSKHFVTEQGDVEDWQNAFSKEQLAEMFGNQLEEFKKQVDEYKNSENNNE